MQVVAAVSLAVTMMGRAAAESLMTATWRIERETGEFTEVDYQRVPVREVIYEGKGKLQTYEGHERTARVGESSAVEQRMTLHLPWNSIQTKPGDLAICTGSTDALLIGRRFRITQQYPVKEHATAYRVFVDELIEG